MNCLSTLRKEIDEINLQLIELLSQRLELAKKIANIKKQQKLPIDDKLREIEQLDSIKALAKERALSPTMIENLFSMIFEYSRIIQKLEG